MRDACNCTAWRCGRDALGASDPVLPLRQRYPAHIHILKVNPDSRDRVQAGKLWGAESKKGGAQEDEATDGDEVGFASTLVTCTCCEAVNLHARSILFHC
jgi:hypothetical protein